MNDHAASFVNDHQLFIFKQNVERNILRDNRIRRRRRDRNLHGLAVRQPVTGFAGNSSIHGDMPFGNQTLDLRTRQLRHAFGQTHIQPLFVRFRSDREGLFANHHCSLPGVAGSVSSGIISK